MGRKCPVAGCYGVVATGKFMCRAHWFGLPGALRDEIWRTWRRVRDRNANRTPERRREDIRDYRRATEEAEKWWRR